MEAQSQAQAQTMAQTMKSEVATGEAPKSLKSILKNTGTADDQWFPAWGTAVAAQASLEEDKRQAEPAEVRQPEAFTELPASSNEKLMEFEKQLLLKAGKKPPVISSKPPSSHSSTTVPHSSASEVVSAISSSDAQQPPQPATKAKPRFKVGIPRNSRPVKPPQ